MKELKIKVAKKGKLFKFNNHMYEKFGTGRSCCIILQQNGGCRTFATALLLLNINVMTDPAF